MLKREESIQKKRSAHTSAHPKFRTCIGTVKQLNWGHLKPYRGGIIPYVEHEDNFFLPWD